MEDVFLLAGSNMGDRGENLAQARSYINEEAGKIFLQSHVYESDPWGFEAKVPFFNQVIALRTNLTPEELLDTLLKTEIRMGRIRYFSDSACHGEGCGIPESGQRYESRLIDLDILFFGSRMVFTERLMIPHPRLHERRFTLVPLAEVTPELTHPVLKKSISQLLSECQDELTVKKIRQ